jgi:hypothetical protein
MDMRAGGGGPPRPRPAPAEPARVGTTDWWKLAGLALVLADHYGLFFDPDTDGWRVVGRIAAPIFFFLIGFARTRTVPWSWIVLGVTLTAVDTWTTGEGLGKVNLNILINFAWLRLVRPYVSEHVLGRPWRVAAVALAAAALIRPVQQVLEYGAEGWLWALFGATQARALETGSARDERTRDGVAAFTAAVYAWKEIVDYDFEREDALALVPLVVGLAYLLTRFSRAESAVQPPAALVPAIRWCGRHSLEIYGISLLAMQLLGYALGES